MFKDKENAVLAVVFAALALVAISPSSAMGFAGEFKAAEYPATLNGAQVAGEKLEFVFNSSGTVQCNTATLFGTLGAASSVVSLHPTFNTCTALTFGGATLSTTGCDFKLESGSEKSPGIFDGTLNFVCSVGSAMKLVAGTCELEMMSVNLLASLEFINMAPGGGSPEDFTAKFSVGSVPYTVTKDGIGCPLVSTGNFTNGSIRGKETITGTVNGNPKAVFVG